MGYVILVIFIIVLIISIISTVSAYNKMVRYKNKVNESLALVDIHLKLRFDLVPNLVKVVKEYSKHEKEVFTKVIELRNLAVNEKEEKKKLELANELLPKIREILVIGEDYPELKADTLYRSLMEELVEIEDKIAASRRFYDSNVTQYNNTISVFPNNVVASMFSFEKCELFKIDVGETFNQKLDFNE